MKTGLGKYDVLDVAQYVLWYAENTIGSAITNLQLQKILYYIQGEYIYAYGDPLFNNVIEAWAYGPVIPEAYYEYSENGSKKIKGVRPDKMRTIDKEDKFLIRKVIKSKIEKNIWDIVRETHEEDPWYFNYEEYQNNTIPLSDIESWFKRGRYEQR